MKTQTLTHTSSQDGDLSGTTCDAGQTPLYSFSLDPSLDTNSLCLSEKLDLGVGERGVIGRRVSVMTRSVGGRGATVVAEGVMGWN